MSSAIELIVDGFAKLKDRPSLEDLRMHRQRLAADLALFARMFSTVGLCACSSPYRLPVRG